MATWDAPLPDEAHAGDTGHVADHNEIVAAITEARTNVDAAEKTAVWGSVTGKPSTFPPTIGTTATTALAGNTAIPAAYTDAKAVAALKAKPAVAALTAESTVADIVAALQA